MITQDLVANTGPAANAAEDTGASQSGAYVEFDAPENVIQTENVGPRNTGMIPSDKPVDISQMSPIAKVSSWASYLWEKIL